MTGIRPTMGSNVPCPATDTRTRPFSRRTLRSILKSAGLAVLLVRAIRRFTVRPVLPRALQALGELAGNLRWSWHPETQDLFADVDPDAWAASGHDPVRMLGSVPMSRLEELAGDRAFKKRLTAARKDLEEYLTGDRWYQRRDTKDARCRARSATSPRSSASPPCCRSTPAVSASWPATTSRPPATSACRSSVSA